MQQPLVPKIVTVVQEGYSGQQLWTDVLSGIVVGIVALPLAIAFAIASGVSPERGLYTAIVGGFVVALLGGSRVQVSGPTGAFIVVVYAIVEKYGYEGLAISTFLAGIMLIGMGFLRMGTLLRFVPYPVTIGFTSGIALIIFSSQIKDFFGLNIQSVPAPFIEKWVVYANSFGSINLWSILVGCISLAILGYFPKVTRRIPSSLVALLASTLFVAIFKIPVDLIGTRYGVVEHTLPAPQLLNLSYATIRELFSPAMTIAFLGAIESLLSASVADGMLGMRHRSNMELIAQGIGNMFSAVFGGIPVTGAIARTSVNVRNGGRTPVAAMVHALILLLIMIKFGRYAAYIPMATLAAILIYVAYNMSELSTFAQVMKAPRSDISVLWTTFLLTVLIDLTVAIEVGVVLSAFLFLQRMQSVSGVGRISDLDVEIDEHDDPNPISKKRIPPGVEVFELFGPLFFGVVDRFKSSLLRSTLTPKVLILRMRNVPAIDASGLQALEDAISKAKKDNFVLLFSSLRPQPLDAARKAGIVDKIGRENVLPTVDAALKRASEIIEE